MQMKHSKILTALEGECWDTSESNNKSACLVPPGISGEQQLGEYLQFPQLRWANHRNHVPHSTNR